MKPLRLYIENFYCHKQSFIDFTKFDSALIIAKINDNEDYSNGAGKTSVFKALEYVLFNETPSKLETIIRDDTDYCKVTFDFELDNDIYRVCRKKTKKNNDLTLFKKNINDDSFIHIEDEFGYHLATNALDLKEHWNNLTSTRSSDTEKYLLEILKTNYKFFCNTSHFMQNDFSGIATTSPEKRRQMLKESLDLKIYSTLEKVAKNKFNQKSKDLDRVLVSIDNIGLNINEKILESQNNILLENNEIEKLNIKINDLLVKENNTRIQTSIKKEELTTVKNSIDNFISNKNRLTNEVNELKNKITLYKNKLSSVKQEGEDLKNKSKNLVDKKNELKIEDYSEFETQLSLLNQELANNNSIIYTNKTKYEELIIPMPNDDQCKHCRQTMTKEHKKQCQESIQKEMENCNKNISSAKDKITKLNLSISEIKNKISNIKINNEKISKIDNEIINLNNLLDSKRNLFKDYKDIVKSSEDDLQTKNNELSEVINKIDSNSISKISLLEKEVIELNNQLNSYLVEKNNLNSTKTKLESNIAVLNHKIKDYENDIVKLSDLELQKKNLQKQLEHYPNVIQAFSNKGIPSLIIQNLLDELQSEANELLEQLKPGLQLQFIVTKEKSDDDTLDILYFVNNRPRYYQQLSGAMQICVMFALKLGWSFLLQKKFGFVTPILLLDEVDQSLDKAGVNAFVDIVKFFQSKFKILIITHNDRLKGKLNNIICVKQDKDKISQAKLG